MLTVLSVAYPLARVSEAAVGGAEQILSDLDRALVAAGHRSMVVACEGSQVAGELLPIPATPEPFSDAAHAAAQAAIGKILQSRTRDASIVHLHGIDFDKYLPPEGPPALATLHLPPSWYAAEALSPPRPRTWLHCVSSSQHRALQHLPHTPNLLDPIENGVDVDALGAVRHGKRRYALMLGRICPEKGQHVALQAAHQAEFSLLIGGTVFAYPAHKHYFATSVAPQLDVRRRFLGPLGFARKRRLLAGAQCLLVPSTAPETSSLVTMEALACGTPVIAYPSGALAELIDPGRTGFLVRSAEEMAAAIAVAPSIDPNHCRQIARQRFCQSRMIETYLRLYHRLAAA